MDDFIQFIYLFALLYRWLAVSLWSLILMALIERLQLNINTRHHGTSPWEQHSYCNSKLSLPSIAHWFYCTIVGIVHWRPCFILQYWQRGALYLPNANFSRTNKTDLSLAKNMVKFDFMQSVLKGLHKPRIQIIFSDYHMHSHHGLLVYEISINCLKFVSLESARFSNYIHVLACYNILNN